MGRKSNSKKNQDKEFDIHEQQKRKELGVITDKLLKLTSVFQATVTPAKIWEQHLEIESILKQIQNIENPRTNSEHIPRHRQSNVEQFLRWLNENGAQYDGTCSNFLSVTSLLAFAHSFT